jgi:GTPase SAR1 family protein
LSIEEYVEGTKCFVSGVKGSGKTAFLRFIQNRVKRDKHITKFIVFSEDVIEREREHILPFEDVDLHDLPEIEKEADVTDIWQIFLYREIARIIDENEDRFQVNAYVKEFISVVKSLYDGDNVAYFENCSMWLSAGRLNSKAPVVLGENWIWICAIHPQVRSTFTRPLKG